MSFVQVGDEFCSLTRDVAVVPRVSRVRFQQDDPFVLVRLAYLTVRNAFAVLWLLPMGDREKDSEILSLCHGVMVLRRQLGGARSTFDPADRALLATLPRETL